MTDSCQVYSKNDYESGDGMLTTVWGPSLWHYLHIISFNYPVRPSRVQKKKYREFIMNLKYTLPCKYCRDNLKNNLKDHPLTAKSLKNRENFSKWMFTFHEHINKMLGKSSGLSFDEVRERYEHFRARCTIDDTGRPKKSAKQKGKKSVKLGSGMRKNKTVKKEKGCTVPLYGKKSKCVIKIVPQDKKCNTFQMDKKCKKTRKMRETRKTRKTRKNT